jgi:uncharacterized protein
VSLGDRSHLAGEGESTMPRKYLEVLAGPNVLREQERYYGRARPVRADGERDPLGPREAEFVAARDSFYMATVGEAGWPYVQHRGGPRGFLKVLTPNTLAFADYEGNRQLLSTGNLVADDRVSLFLMDYPNQRRLKVLGHARVEDARERPDLVDRLGPHDDGAHVERVVLIDVVSFDWNCPQHVTPRFSLDQVRAAVEPLQREVEELRARLASTPAPDRG